MKIPAEEFYKTLLDNLFDAVYTVDKDGTISYWNQSCIRLTGYSAKEMVGQHYKQAPFFYRTKEQQEQEDLLSGIGIVLETGMEGKWKGYIQRKNGQRLPVESHVSALRGEGGEIICAVEVFRDISAYISLEDAHRQLLHVSRQDHLTGLFNRAAIGELLKAEVERSRRYQQKLSVVLVDIDRFKRVNDRYGHDMGDLVLSKIGAVLKHNLRQPDAVGRWGGEEFLIVAPGSDDEAAEKMAQRMREYIKKINDTNLPEGITASFGVAQLKPQLGTDQLLYIADMALYEAKNCGRDRVVIGSEELLKLQAGKV